MLNNLEVICTTHWDWTFTKFNRYVWRHCKHGMLRQRNMSWPPCVFWPPESAARVPWNATWKITIATAVLRKNNYLVGEGCCFD